LCGAFVEAGRRHPTLARRLRLAIVGDGPLLGELRVLTKQCGIEALTWLPGAIQDVSSVLRAFDIFILPSLAEGISNTILEAMASGLPYSRLPVGGNVEIVDDGRTGRLFAARDIPSLTATDRRIRHRRVIARGSRARGPPGGGRALRDRTNGRAVWRHLRVDVLRRDCAHAATAQRAGECESVS
jgi:glycosyltransferase involved in cell wall biosynthesis